MELPTLINTQLLNKHPPIVQIHGVYIYKTFTPSQECPTRSPPSFGMRTMAIFINYMYPDNHVVDPLPFSQRDLHRVHSTDFSINFR